MTVTLQHYLVVSALLFSLGLLGVIIRRNLLIIYTCDNLGRLTRKDYPDGTSEQELYTIAAPYPNGTG